MDRSFFDRQLIRLSRSFAQVPQKGMGDEYWGRLKHHDPVIFTLAVDRLLDESDRFPNIAAIHRVYYEERERARADTAETQKSESAMHEAARENVERLQQIGFRLPSDNIKGVPIRVGTREHERRLRFYDRMIGTLTRIVDERGAQLDSNPDEPDLERRYGVLTHALGEMSRDREHFARTGLPIPTEPLSPTEVNAIPGVTLYHCLTCKDHMFVRVDVQPNSRHFGGSGSEKKHTPIPCPHCNGRLYDEYVAKYGVPPTMPNRAPFSGRVIP